MRRTFWSLMLTGVAITALAGFSPTTQEAEAGLFSRMRAKFHGNCAGACDVVATCCPPAPSCCPPAPPTCCPPAPPTCCPQPCGGGGCGGGGCGSDCDNDFDDDCDD